MGKAADLAVALGGGVKIEEGEGVGFDTAVDTPQRMDVFAKQQGIADTRWLFVSGDEAAMSALTRDIGFTYRPSPKGFDHLGVALSVGVQMMVRSDLGGSGVMFSLAPLYLVLCVKFVVSTTRVVPSQRPTACPSHWRTCEGGCGRPSSQISRYAPPWCPCS